MSNDVVLLGSQTVSLPVPKQPAFLTRRTLSSTASKSNVVTVNISISDGEGESLVSPEKKFELGIYTPNGSSKSNTRRYLRIRCYGSNSQKVVWVANQDKPLFDDSGVFVVAEDGNLKVLDRNGKSLWSANLEAEPCGTRKAKLSDTGTWCSTMKKTLSGRASITRRIHFFRA
ncbi:hypothetical protein F3Y22_tig00112344pilonHSYRG00114 [Hibiscus syriacus]|uniref:Bulb-type lectin domain-containing protein n=1 Tax=Hibiscus syriacus TaxID=106335 RepID=A0A6A2X135_HIBSY|nr:hypothetical protein F3Y22_tig00112344pilonHSYRG00114 [Hibiscus syriacus]